MALDHLFACRHGDNIKLKNGGLTSLGLQKVENMAKMIQKIIGERSRSLISSTANRAIQGAERMSENIRNTCY